MGRITLLLLLIIILPCGVFAYDIPEDRSVTWQGNVGTANTIPSAGTEINCVDDYSVPIDGTTNATTAINSCITGISSGQVAYLPSGNYAISGAVTIQTGKVLRGAGIGQTNLKSYVGGTYNQYLGLVDFQVSGTHLSSAIGLASGYTKGSTEITASADVTWSVGDIIIIDQTNAGTGADPPVSNVGSSGTCSDGRCGRANGERAQGQVNKIAGLGGAGNRTVTLEIPLYWTLLAEQTPQMVKLQTVVVNAGLESLTIDVDLGDPDTALSLWSSANCWLYRVEVKNSNNINTRLAYSYRNTIRESVFRNGGVIPPTPNSGYGLLFQYAAGANLIDNNVFYELSTPILMEGETSGNVIAYNYMPGHSDTSNNRQSGVVRPHGAHPFMNLFEGNQGAGQWVFDNDWGTMSHNTIFRNRIQLQILTGHAGAAWNIQNMIYARYQNIIGNVIGTSEVEGAYEYESDTVGWTDSAIYKTGYLTEGDGTAADNDAAVHTTMLRHRNYIYAPSAGLKDCGDAGEPGCQGGDTDTSIANSLYLASKPTWFGGLIWPPVDPDTPTVGDIPAKRYYETGIWPGDISGTANDLKNIGTGAITWTPKTDGIGIGITPY